MKPIELYRFFDGSDNTVFAQVRHGALGLVYNDEAYLPYAIGSSVLEQKSDMSRVNLDIELDIDNPVAKRYFANPVDAVITLTVFMHVNGTTNTWWRGRLVGTKGGSDKKVVLKFESVFSSQKRTGCRARFLRSCRHTLYGRGCGLDPEDWKVSGTVTAIDGLVLDVTGIGASVVNRYRGGMLRAPSGVVRFIGASTTTQVTLSRRFEELEALIGGGPIAVDFYPGCAHNLAACIEFGNAPRYGGFPRLPTINPFGTSIV